MGRPFFVGAAGIMADTLLRKGRGAVRPTLEMVRGWAVALRNHYRVDDEEIDQMRRIRELTESVPLPPRLARIKAMEMNDATINDEIARVVAALTNFLPKLIITPADPAAGSGQESSDHIEDWTMAAIQQCATRVPGRNELEMAMDACVADGAAWLKLVHDPHVWERVWSVSEDEEYDADIETGDAADDDTPRNRVERRTRSKTNRKYLDDREAAKKRAGIPFHVLCADVRCVYPVWNGTRLARVLEISERPLIEVMERYQLRFRKEDALYGQPISEQEAMRYGQTCTFYECWDADYVTYAAEVGEDRRVLEQRRHGYGFVPYYYAPGLVQNQWRGRKKGWGVGHSKKELVRWRQFAWNLVINMAAQTAGAPLVHTRPDGGERIEGTPDMPEGETQMWDLNGVIDLNPGEDYKVLQMPGIPPALVDLIQTLNQQIQQLDTPRISAAIGGDMAGAGFAMAQASSEIRVKHQPYATHIEAALVALTRDFWQLLRHFHGDEKLYIHNALTNPQSAIAPVSWLSLTPNQDLRDEVGIKWVVNSEPVTADIVRSRYWLELHQAHLASADEAIEGTGRNPATVRRGLTMDRLRQEGFVMDYQNTRVMEKLEAGDLLRQAAQAAAETGLLPGMLPGMPGQAPGGFGPPMAQPPGAPPGGPMMPDQGMLAAAPGGQGAVPLPPPGPTPGIGRLPAPGIQAGAQAIMPGGG